MSWSFSPVFDAGHRAALESGKPLIYVSPPAGWAVRPLYAALPATAGELPLETLILVPEMDQGLDLADAVEVAPAMRPVYQATGLARAGRLLAQGAVRTLIATPTDALRLVANASLKLEGIQRIVVANPEFHALVGGAPLLDQLLAEARGAQRVITATALTTIADFLERHARRAAVQTAAALAEAPVGRARYAVVNAGRVPSAVRAALDALDPSSALIWDPTPEAGERWARMRSQPGVRVAADPGDGPVAAAIAADVPSADALAALVAVASDVLLLVRPWQVPYLAKIAHPLTAFPLGGETDRALEWRFALRQTVRDRLAAGTHRSGLLALGPLFEEFDPAVVAAALAEAPAAAVPDDIPRWVRLHLSVGRRDQVRAGDVVGALLNATGITRDDVGRVDIRETFTLVDVRDAAAVRARRGLEGVTLRGKAIAVRFDRR